MSPEYNLLAVLLVLGSVTVTVVALVLRHVGRMRELLSRERLAAVEKGVEIPWEMDLRWNRRAGRTQLKAGIILAGAGLGLAGASAFLTNRHGALAWAIFLVMLALANIVYDLVVGRKESERLAALDEGLTRAYIRRLEAGTRPTHGGGAEDSGPGR